MARCETEVCGSIDRRTFLFGGLTAVASMAAQARLETLTDWLRASRQDRARGMGACLDRIHELDPSIHAWVQVLPQGALGGGRLSGIPFGVKDVIETKGLATEYGSPIYKGRLGTADAAIVRDLRRRGGVLLGKTEAAAFGYRTPAPTRNPRDLTHTPGGSSSGSAAAVAAGMVPLAIGTQTGGSIIRPASFCGVTGFKASYGLFSLDGVLPFAKSLDTLGFFTHTAEDMLAFWEALGRSSGRAEDRPLGAVDPLPEVEPVMAATFRAAVSRLRDAGVVVHPIDITDLLAKVYDAQRVIMFFEGARAHEARFRQYGSRLADLADLVRDGLQIPVERYEDATRVVAESRTRMADLYKATPVILVPAALGPAPSGLTSTGDSRLNAQWTALGTPAMSIPMPVTDGLPLGLQLTADRGQDAALIRIAVRLQHLLAG